MEVQERAISFHIENSIIMIDDETIKYFENYVRSLSIFNLDNIHGISNNDNILHDEGTRSHLRFVAKPFKSKS